MSRFARAAALILAACLPACGGGSGASHAPSAVAGMAASNGGASAGAETGGGSGGSDAVAASGAGAGGSSGTVASSGGAAGAAGAAGASGAAGAAGTGGTSGVSGIGFVHPGLLVTAQDIAHAKAKLASKSEPWNGNFNTLRDNNLSSATRAHSVPPAIIGRNAASAYAGNRGACEVDAVSAYQNAMLFVLTGQTEHADQAVKILNAYAAGVRHFDTVDPERDLEAAILGWLWVSSAELLRYSGYDYAGWAPADVTQFNVWIKNVVYADTAYNASGVLVTPIPNGAGARGAFALRTKLAIGVYLDDKAIFDQATDYFFNGQGNGAPQYYIDPTTGQTWESGRDQGHAQGGLSRLLETAHIAHNQGNDALYAWGNDALSRAFEYIAQYNLGSSVPYRPMQPFTLDWSAVYDTISADGRGQLASIYELPYRYWHGDKGKALPFTLQAIEKEGSETFSVQYDNPMFATLWYRAN